LADYMGSMFETSLFFIEMAGQAHGIVSWKNHYFNVTGNKRNRVTSVMHV
jgi:hypothetical protein